MRSFSSSAVWASTTVEATVLSVRSAAMAAVSEHRLSRMSRLRMVKLRRNAVAASHALLRRRDNRRRDERLANGEAPPIKGPCRPNDPPFWQHQSQALADLQN
jgi:hypothetical protein